MSVCWRLLRKVANEAEMRPQRVLAEGNSVTCIPAGSAGNGLETSSEYDQ